MTDAPFLAPGWDSRLVVVRGGGPADLRARALAGDFTGDGPVALAVIATSPDDLQKKLRKAADRLADPRCPHIRDAAGIYYTTKPLHGPGALALLFPGEGAQYSGMLADLCGVFPEVEETFAWADRLATEAGRPETSLRRIINPPADASPEERAVAESELRKLGPSIFGVLLADLAISRVLESFDLPVTAVAGHSAGELAALLAAGAIQSDAILNSHLTEMADLMQRQEDAATGDVALLAVGAGRDTVREVAAAVAGGAVEVAMDNCPHQCVAVGPTHLVAAVETALAERGLLCERLPFRRPYHTPLFEPWMGPFREWFAGMPFTAPHTRAYSCSTAAPFPADPDAIRTLAVNHWVSPVEFTRLIETMYADGVRLFVEVGPRGNLSAFVEDILRGRPFAAIPANTPRRSGPTQINHLVAQLVAHGVPVKLDGLTWGQVFNLSDPAVSHAGPIVRAEVGQVENLSPREDATAVLTAYLDTMDQFLDVQQAVMGAYLSGTAEADPFHFTPAADAPKSFALVGEVVHFEPGREIIFRRVMDEREDRYADDHTLGGRGVSREDPGQNGLPVLPMTFSLEAMAEAASLLVPGKVVVAIRNVRLYRWLPFDPDPTTLEVRATVAAVDPEAGTAQVKADVRDLGNSFVRDGATKAASEAVIVLADSYPKPPNPLAFELTDETPCRSTVEDLRRNMFHGPTFQMIRSLGRTGREGIEGTLEVQPRDRWFRSDPDPVVAIDPVLMDAAMHILGAWHLEQPDWTGRILLPFEVTGIEFFGPTPAVGSLCVVRGHNEQESARHFRHGLELFDPDGRVWMRLTGAGYWRFYLPFGHVNFFGPKDEYFLSRDWPEAVPGRGRCHFIDPPVDLKQPVLRAAGARVTMTPRELAEFRAWAGTDAELNDWFFGRMLAKDAVRAAWYAKHGDAMFPADIETEALGNGFFRTWPRGAAKAEPFPPVAVAIADGKVAAFSAFAEHIGIALLAIGKDEPEGPVRTQAAVRAVANALGLPEGEVAADDPRVRVQTARQKDVVVATAIGEPA
jgi:malonyl CoA-acyl carrier protein transacylase